MNRNRKFIYFIILLALVMALPATALARKNVFKARLSTGAELHEVVGSSAQGSAVFGLAPDGMQFMLHVRGLSGPATGAHIHAPATASETAPVIISLCGHPAPAAFAECTTDASGTLTIQGHIGSSLMAQWGLGGAQLISYLESGTAYVNVHTSLDPAGEARGQIE